MSQQAKIFDKEFMETFKEKWNTDATIPSTLASINFHANVGYGYLEDTKPTTVLIVKQGKAEIVKAYEETDVLDWDIRCSKQNWKYYFKNGLGMSGLGSAYAMGWIKFIKGDYFSMIKNPSMINPFLKSFDLLGQVYKSKGEYETN